MRWHSASATHYLKCVGVSEIMMGKCVCRQTVTSPAMDGRGRASDLQPPWSCDRISIKLQLIGKSPRSPAPLLFPLCSRGREQETVQEFVFNMPFSMDGEGQNLCLLFYHTPMFI